MKFIFLAFLVALSGAFASWSSGNGYGGGSGWGGGGRYLRRDSDAAAAAAEPAAEPAAAADSPDGSDKSADSDDGDQVPTQALLSQAIEGFLGDARKGMDVAKMAAEAVAVQSVADLIVESQGGKVSKDKVEQEITDAASSLSGVVAVSSLFDEALDFEDSRMDSALRILNSLNQQAQKEIGDGKPYKATVAAISMTAEAIQDILSKAVGIYAFNEVQAQQSGAQEKNNVNKRWTFEGGVSTGPGGTTYSGSISHTWNGRRKRNVTKRGQFTGTLGGSYGPGGATVSAGISYTWGKRR